METASRATSVTRLTASGPLSMLFVTILNTGRHQRSPIRTPQAMASIFDRSTDRIGGLFSADALNLTLPDVLGTDVGLLVQEMNVAYQQQATRLYECGRPTIYYVGGRTAGDSHIARMLGPAAIQQAIYRKYGNINLAKTNSLHFSTPTNRPPDLSDSRTIGDLESCLFNFCVITGLGVSIQAADLVISDSMRFLFSSLEYKNSQITASPANPDSASSSEAVSSS
jgi:hypothetical protein